MTSPNNPDSTEYDYLNTRLAKREKANLHAVYKDNYHVYAEKVETPQPI